MAEPTQYAFTHKEIVECLIKRQGLHDGIWALYMEFGIGAGNITRQPGDDSFPAAFVPVLKIGLTRVNEVTNLSADARVVSPRSKPAKPKKRSTEVSG
jgi:hypothetical protein